MALLQRSESRPGPIAEQISALYRWRSDILHGKGFNSSEISLDETRLNWFADYWLILTVELEAERLGGDSLSELWQRL